MAEEKLLTKVNLNGTELVIADANARSTAKDAIDRTVRISASTAKTDYRVAVLEDYSMSLITATYDAQSQTLSLTSKGDTPTGE